MPAAEVFLPILGYVKTELIINCVIVSLVLLVVGLRVLGRLLGPGLGWDDYFIISAVPLGIAMLVCQGLFAPVGNGYDLPDNLELKANVPFILQLTFGMQVIYVVLLTLVKASMLFFFLRVFITPFVQLASKITLGFLLAWAIAFTCACVFLCDPIKGQWTGEGKCGEYMPMIQSLIATNAIGDLVIMVLPMHSIWSLQMRKTDKVGITASFALGLACIVCAIFRLFYIPSVDLNANITGTMPTTVFLFILEPNLAILCVSIPMLRPFYTMYKKRMGGSRLQEISSDAPSRYISSKSATQGGGGGGNSRPRRGNNSQEGLSTAWEMEDYYARDGTVGHDTMVTTGADSTPSRESSAHSAKKPAVAIDVQTKWTVTRE